MKKLDHILPRPHGLLVAAVILYLLSFLFIQSFSPLRSFESERGRLEKYIHEEQKEFDAFVADTLLIHKLAEKRESEEELKVLVEKNTGLFVYRKEFSKNQILFWNNQVVLPPDDIFGFPDTVYYKKNANGYYVSIKRTITKSDEDSLLVIGMIPVLYEYSMHYFPDRFAHSETAISKIQISAIPNEYRVRSLSGDILFYVSPQAQTARPPEDLPVILKLIAIFFLLLYIHSIAEQLARQYGLWKGLVFLLITLVGLRVFNYYTSFPINLRQFELFNPNIYASSSVNKSLGDLLINSIFFCWIVLFTWQKLEKAGFYILIQKGKRTVIGILSSVIVVFFTFFMSYIIRTLAADSNISFDVINFFSLSIFTGFGFVTLAILAVGYYYFMRIMIPVLTISFNNNFYPVYVVTATAGLTFLTFEINNSLLVFYMIALGWLIFYIWLSQFRKFGINNSRQTMAGALFWIFLFSVSISAVIVDANREKELQERIAMASSLDERTDPYNVKELGISVAFLDNDFLAPNFYRFKDEELAISLRDSILRNREFSSHFDSRLYVFDADKKSLFNDERTTFNELDATLVMRAHETHLSNLYYVETAFDKNSFIFKRTVTDSAKKVLGYFFIVSDPEQYNSETLETGVFKRPDRLDPDNAQMYSYGIYMDSVLSTGPTNKYPFPTNLTASDIPDELFEKINRNGYTELWYKAKSGYNQQSEKSKPVESKIIVLVRKKATALEAITLFSYIFCIFLFLVAFFNLLLLLLRVGGNFNELRRILEWNIRTQIHGTIIFISILSFVIIGIATISFFVIRYNQNNEERLSRTMDIMIREMQKKLDNRLTFDDLLPIYDSVSNEGVQTLVDDVAEIHNMDVNVYDTAGRLQVTSQPLVYRDNYLSRQMHPLGFYHLNRLRQVQHLQQENLATVSYVSIYAPLRSADKGVVYAYLNIPYFLSQSEIKQEISNFLVTIINLNAFIFLIAGVIALFITNRVTRSFLLISEKMKEINLGQTNEQIEWKRNDEIGGLVREYNKMVEKLEVSAEALARSEREGAWREMARQVAHEIKNPLTPMKLSIQFLQKSIDNNSDNVKELTAKVARTLVEQIDHLSKIAFDFSQFANIGNTNIETFDINEVIRSLDNLYKTSHEGELKLNTVPGKVMVRADKTQMNRLFTNLIQNAIEACNGKGKCNIELNEVQFDGVVQISIKDNGEGIPKEMHSKIFVPNFTTKSSGTGLGLAMCKGIAEQAGGRIWFETKTGEGSTFYVELPVAN
ncbi:MAG TPA: HAMP domain-containing sensor histidine kinase [Chitinophagaceae bacterium]